MEPKCEQTFDKQFNVIKQYIVRGKNRDKKGVLISCLSDDLSTIQVGYSLCSKNDTFDKYFGTFIAFQRAEKSVNKTSIIITHSIRSDFAKFLAKSQRYFKDKKLPDWTISYKK